jgi:hypothetical protein
VVAESGNLLMMVPRAKDGDVRIVRDHKDRRTARRRHHVEIHAERADGRVIALDEAIGIAALKGDLSMFRTPIAI